MLPLNTCFDRNCNREISSPAFVAFPIASACSGLLMLGSGLTAIIFAVDARLRHVDHSVALQNTLYAFYASLALYGAAIILSTVTAAVTCNLKKAFSASQGPSKNEDGLVTETIKGIAGSCVVAGPYAVECCSAISQIIVCCSELCSEDDRRNRA